MAIKKIIDKCKFSFRLMEEMWFGNKILKKSLFSAPDFMIIGAAKAGTTSLFQYLSQHPQIISAKEKELLYFSINQHKGLGWFLENFPEKEVKNGRLAFEGSPSYMYYPEGLKRIKHLFPDIKLILILRDPIKRAFSQWNFQQKGSSFIVDHPDALDNRSFKKAISEEIEERKLLHPLHRYLYRSNYALHLNNIFRFFDRQQVLVLDFDELKNQSQKVLEEVTCFLEIENIYKNYKKSNERIKGLLQIKDEDNNQKLKTYNANSYKEELDQETEELLKCHFAAFDDEIMRLTNKQFGWMKEYAK